MGSITDKHLSEEHKIKIGNSQRGEKGHNWGKSPSKETREKISKANKGIRISEKHKQILSRLKKGKPLSKDHRRKLSESHKGKKLTEEQRIKIGDAMRGEKNPRWKGGEKRLKAVYRHKRRALKIQSGGSFTLGEWELLKKQYDYTCPCCSKRQPEINLTVDHIIPICKGGSNWIQNIQPLCQLCNSKKTTKVFRIKPNGELRLF